jgi:nucleotide-binding universal stress UspA family protein
VVPLDGSELAEVALPLAIDLASRAGATIILTQSLLAQMGRRQFYGYGYAPAWPARS